MQENYFDIRSVDGQPIENLRIHVESSGDLPTSEATAQGYFYRAVAPYSVVPGFSDESQQGYGFRYDLNLRIKPVAKPEVPEAPTTKKRAGKKPR